MLWCAPEPRPIMKDAPMAQAAHDLFPDSKAAQEERMQTGILPSQQIRALVRKHAISATEDVLEQAGDIASCGWTTKAMRWRDG